MNDHNITMLNFIPIGGLFTGNQLTKWHIYQYK